MATACSEPSRRLLVDKTNPLPALLMNPDAPARDAADQRDASGLLPWLPRSVLSPTTKSVNAKLGQMQLDMDAAAAHEALLAAPDRQSVSVASPGAHPASNPPGRASSYVVDGGADEDGGGVQQAFDEITAYLQVHQKNKKDMDDPRTYGSGGMPGGDDTGLASPISFRSKLRVGGRRASPRLTTQKGDRLPGGSDADEDWETGYTKAHLKARLKVLREDDAAREEYELKVRERIARCKVMRGGDGFGCTSTTMASTRSHYGTATISSSYRHFDDRRAYVLTALEKQYDDHQIKALELETRDERKALADVAARQQAGWSVAAVHFLTFGRFTRARIDGIKARLEAEHATERCKQKPAMTEATATRIICRFIYRGVLKNRIAEQKKRIHLINQFLHHQQQCRLVPRSVKALLRAVSLVQRLHRKNLVVRRARQKLAILQVTQRHIGLIKRADTSVDNAEEKLREALAYQSKSGRVFPAKCAGMVSRAEQHLDRCIAKKREYESIDESVLLENVERELKIQSRMYQKRFINYCQELLNWKRRKAHMKRMVNNETPYLRAQLLDAVALATIKAREQMLLENDRTLVAPPVMPLPRILFTKDKLSELFAASVEHSKKKRHKRVIQVAGCAPLSSSGVIPDGYSTSDRKQSTHRQYHRRSMAGGRGRVSLSDGGAAMPTIEVVATSDGWRPGHRAGATRGEGPRGSTRPRQGGMKRPRLEDVLNRPRASVQEARTDTLNRLTEYQWANQDLAEQVMFAGRLKTMAQKWLPESVLRRKSVRYNDTGLTASPAPDAMSISQQSRGSAAM